MIGEVSDGFLELSRGRRIPIEFRTSERARRLRLSLNKKTWIMVTSPYGCSHIQTMEFLRTNIPWLERMLDKMPKKTEKRAELNRSYPGHLFLPSTGEDFPIRLEWRDVAWLAVRESNGILELTGKVLHADAVRECMTGYLKRKAEKVFASTLKQLADQYGFTYQKLTVRFQQGRWGSCSGRGTISLNGKMLFFTPEELRYVMIHELCHTREMNHSARFWQEVGKYCPDYLMLRAQIRSRDPDSYPWIS